MSEVRRTPIGPPQAWTGESLGGKQALLIGLFLIVLGPRFIGVWIDPSYEGPSGRVLQILMISSLVFLPIRGVAIPILMGIGKPRTPTIAAGASSRIESGASLAMGPDT